MVGGWRGLRNRVIWALLLFGLAYGYTRWIAPPRHYTYTASGVTLSEVEERWVWQLISERTMVYGILCLGLDVLLIAGRIFGSERRGLTLASLVALPWSTRRIFWQKVLGCLPALAVWVLLIGIGMAAHPEDLVQEIFDSLWHFKVKRDLDDLFQICYGVAQGLGFLFLTVLLSLRIRRGALPAAMVLMVVWNVLFFLCLDSVKHSNEGPMFFLGALMTFCATIFIYHLIHRQMQAAAAED
jgi:hypothetical protein